MLLIDAASGAELADLVDRRVGGEPLEHIVGWVQFAGLRIVVEPGVFVPRRRTELLARRAASLALPGASIVDLCCGSGAVGAVVRAVEPSAQLYAADLDPVAVRCARRNLGGHGGPGTERGVEPGNYPGVYQGDLYDALPGDLRGRVDVLVANAPYVPSGQLASLPREARDHEPRRTLDGGPDGLDVIRRIVAGVGEWLASSATLLVEVGVSQEAVARALCAEAGLIAQVVPAPEAGAAVVIASARGR